MIGVQRQNDHTERGVGNQLSSHLRYSIMVEYRDTHGSNHYGRFKYLLRSLENSQRQCCHRFPEIHLETYL